MSNGGEPSSRRRVLKTGLAGTILGLSGCLQPVFGGNNTASSKTKETRNKETTTTTTPSVGPENAKFLYEYRPVKRQVVIKYKGGIVVQAKDLQLQSADGKRVMWAKLGSTKAQPSGTLQRGATAILGENILNWGQQIDRDETIRIVYTGGETPITIGRFTPVETATATTTVPTTTASTPAGTPRQTPIDDLVYKNGFESSENPNVTIHANFVERSNEIAYEGSNSIKADNICGCDCNPDPLVTISPAALSSGRQINWFECYWYETGDSSGAAVSLHNPSGDTVAGGATNNPQWYYWEPKNSLALSWDNKLAEGIGYERWIRFRAEFDWDNDSVTYVFENMRNGNVVNKEISPELGSNGVSEIRLRPFSHEGGPEGLDEKPSQEPNKQNSLSNGSIDNYWDYLRIA